jgi:HrpA-like RNA helicase
MLFQHRGDKKFKLFSVENIQIIITMSSSSGFWKPPPIRDKGDAFFTSISEKITASKKRGRVPAAAAAATTTSAYDFVDEKHNNTDHDVNIANSTGRYDTTSNDRFQYRFRSNNDGTIRRDENRIKGREQQHEYCPATADDDDMGMQLQQRRRHQQHKHDDTTASRSNNSSSSNTPPTIQQYHLSQQRMLLPIYKHKRQILYSIEHYGILIIVGETGAC